MDSLDHDYLPSGSRLLSESSLSAPYASSSHTGPGGDDLSLSELELTRPAESERPFSLFARRPTPPPDEYAEEHGAEEELEGTEEDEEKRARLQAKTREERLQNDLFVLRKLNATFTVYNDALRETESATERVAAQLEQTDALLNKYVNILSKSERITRLMFDEQWRGAEADEEVIEQEERAREEQRRREEQERALAAQRERERREREEFERRGREERERLEREKKEKLASRSTSGVRGIRGTRAQMMRGAATTRGLSRSGTPPTATARGGTRGITGSGPTSGRGSMIGRPSSIARGASTLSKRT